MKQEKYQTDDEIDLMDYVKVILKNKVLILAVFLLAVIIAGIFSFASAKVYKIDAILNIGGCKEESIEDPEGLATAIESGRYEISVRTLLNIAEKDYPEIKAENPKGIRLLIMKIESTETERSKNVLAKHIELILAEHEQELEETVLVREQIIAELQSSLDLLKSQKIYADQGIANLQLSISDLKEKLSSAEPTTVIKQPTVSEIPIKPRPLLNMAIAGILGLFIGVFLAFGREWWKRA